MKKKTTALIIVAILVLSFVTACNKGNGSTPLGELEEFPTISHEIVVSGDGDDPAYDFMPAYTMGVRMNAEVKLINAEEGIYIYMKTKDSTHQYHRSSIQDSDYLEVAFDAPMARPEIPNASIFRLRVDVLGRFEYMQGTGEKGTSNPWKMLVSRNFRSELPTQDIVSGNFTGEDLVTTTHSEGASVKQLVFKKSGTPTCTTSSLSPERPVLEGLPSYSDTDDQYSFEAFFTWNELDSDRVSEMGIAFSHNDIMNVSALTSGYHNNIAVENPSEYHTLRFLGRGEEKAGKGVGRSIVAPEIVIDGKMDDAAWNSAQTLSFPGMNTTLTDLGGPSNPINAKSFFGKEGLYIGVSVADKNLHAPYLDNKDATSIYNNDHTEIRFFLFKNRATEATKTFSVLSDVLGQMWYNTPYTTMGAFDSEYKMTSKGTVGNDSDEDEGWTFELFVPYYELGVEASSKAYAQILCGVKNISLATDGTVINHGIRLNFDADYRNDDNWHMVERFMRIKQ